VAGTFTGGRQLNAIPLGSTKMSSRPENIPTVIGGLGVVLYSQIDERHRPTGRCRHLVNGAGEVGPAWGVAICKDPDTGAFFVYSCEDDWMPAADTWHASLEEAKQQAEFEYEGLAATWEVPPA
jgi:hypothetical protein